MTKVAQYNDYSCVAACLESIKRDGGDLSFSHESFVKDNLSLFSGGTKEEGSCSLQNIPKICDLMDLDCGFFNLFEPFNLSKSDLLLFVLWENQEKDKHCVRLAGFSPDGLVVMNPNNPNGFDTIPNQWVKGAFQITRR